jgi:hypothetical protein
MNKKLIKRSEWDILYRQLLNQGKSKWEASDIISNHKKILEEYYSKLVIKKLTKEDIDLKFKDKFYDMVQRLEE